MSKTAILVDGGFYRMRAKRLWGKKSGTQRASELIAYCNAHIKAEQEYDNSRQLYRIFYYDCPPIGTTVYHPLLKQNINFSKTETYQFAEEFFANLKEKRKVALRLGKLSDVKASYNLNPEKLKKLCNGSITLSDLKEQDFNINFSQKGVDMKIGLDIASLAYKRQVDQIILISGDSDFVPAAKLARREGIDFILDPMWNDISDDLFEHIDGLSSQWRKRKRKATS